MNYDGGGGYRRQTERKTGKNEQPHDEQLPNGSFRLPCDSTK